MPNTREAPSRAVRSRQNGCKRGFRFPHWLVLPACYCLLLAGGAWAQQSPAPAVPASSPEESFQAAQTFQLAGDYERAAAKYHESIGGSLRQLGNLRVSRQEYEEGAGLLARAVQADPGGVEARIDLAIAHFQGRAFEQARTEVEAALRQAPRHVRALNLAGRVAFLQGDFQAAAERLESALQLQADFDTGYLLALADLELKKPVPAGIIFDEMQASAPPNASVQVLVGLAYRETGYLEQAVAHFAKALELEPRKARVRSALGLSHFLQGPRSYAAAREQFLAELAISPGDYTSIFYLGVMAAEEKNAAEAEMRFAQAAALQPGDPGILFRLGQAHLENGHWEQAVAALRKSLAGSAPGGNRPEAAQAHELLGQALAKLGRQGESEAEQAQAKRLRSEPPQPEPKSAAVVSGAGPAGGSGQQELRSMLLRAPRASEPAGKGEAEYTERLSALLGEAYHNLGVIDARASRFAAAADEFAEAARWNPRIEALDRNWGLAAFLAELHPQAIAPLERQLRRAPQDARVRQMLAVCYFMTDQFAKSAETFRPILEQLPDDPGLLYAAGAALVRSGDPAEAGRIFKRMLERGANTPEVHLMVGQAHSGQSEFPEALAEFQRALEMNPRLPEAHYFTGMVHLKQGRIDQAIQEFEAELEVSPDSIPTKYQLAAIRLQQHQSEEALRLLADVLARKPSYGDAQYQMGKALLETGDVQGAIQHLEEATRLQPAQSYGYYQLSLAYRRAGRAAEAQKALRTYQDLKEKRPRPAPRGDSPR